MWVYEETELLQMLCNQTDITKKKKKLYWLGEVSQVLHDFSDEGERAWRLLVRILLGEVEQRRGHDGGTQEAEKERATDETVGDVFSTPLGTTHSPGGKNFLQLTRENTENVLKSDE